ncbi:MAG: RNA polymerase sigma factor, partial [Phycisphaerales bacterium]
MPTDYRLRTRFAGYRTPPFQPAGLLQYGEPGGVVLAVQGVPVVSDRADGWQESEDLSPLLRAAGAGDPSAWRTLVDRYGRRLFALAKSRCCDEATAEDITQSVFATVAAKVGNGEYLESGRFEAWLFRIAMNRIRDHIRRARRRPEMTVPELTTAGVAPASEPAPASFDRLREALELLPEADREIITLRHHGGLS